MLANAAAVRRDVTEGRWMRRSWPPGGKKEEGYEKEQEMMEAMQQDLVTW